MHSKGVEQPRETFADAYKALCIIGIESPYVWHRTKPGHLAFGQLTRGCHGSLHRDVERITSLKVRPQLAVSDRADGRVRLGEIAARMQGAHLVEQPVRH